MDNSNMLKLTKSPLIKSP